MPFFIYIYNCNDKNTIISLGDFKCKELNWEYWKLPGNELSCGNKLLNLAMKNMNKVGYEMHKIQSK